jgi:hypothetical protein
MAKSRRGRRRKKHYDSGGSVVLGQVHLGQAPISLRKSRWLRTGGWVLVALAIAAGGLVVWLTLDARFYVYSAEIGGVRRVSEGEIFEASELMGLHILWARPAAIEARILDKLPSVESVEVACSLPSDCRIAVAERQPRVLWDEDGQLWWIDEEGAVFPAQGGATNLDAAKDTRGRWLVRGPLPRSDEGNLDEQVRVALTELWTSGEDVPTEFDYTTEHGLSFVEAHGWTVIIGQGAGMGERLRILEQLTAHLKARGVTPRFVDVRFPKAPYYAPAGDL